MRSRLQALLVSAGLLSNASVASSDPDADLVLLFCDDATLDGEGSCDALHEAISTELADFDIRVERVEATWPEESEKEPPDAVVQAASEAGVICTIWLPGAVETEDVPIGVFHAGAIQPVSGIVVQEGPEGMPDYTDAAFRLRALVIPGLAPDMPAFEEPEPEPIEEEPEPNEEETVAEPVDEEPVEEDVPLPEALGLRIDLGYLMMGYPTVNLWHHGLGLRVGLEVIPALAVFLDAGATFPQSVSATSRSTGEQVTIDNSQHLVGAGVGYTFTPSDWIAITPLGGFHLGISVTDIRSDDRPTRRLVNTAVWAGIQLRLTPVRHFSITIEASAENLFNYEQFQWDGRRFFGLAQLRFDVFTGLGVDF